MRFHYRVISGEHAGRDCNPLHYGKEPRTVYVIFRDATTATIRLEDLTPRSYRSLPDMSFRQAPIRPKYSADQQAVRRILRSKKHEKAIPA